MMDNVMMTHGPDTRDVMQVDNVMIICYLPVTPLPDLTLGSTPLSVLFIFNVFCICVMCMLILIPQYSVPLCGPNGRGTFL